MRLKKTYGSENILKLVLYSSHVTLKTPVKDSIHRAGGSILK